MNYDLKFYDELENNGICDLGYCEHSINFDMDSDDIINIKSLVGYGDYSCKNIKTEKDLIVMLKRAKEQIKEILENGEQHENVANGIYYTLDGLFYDEDCASIEVIDEIISFLKDQSTQVA